MTIYTRHLKTPLLRLCVLIALGTTPLLAQINFPDFSSVSGLTLNGSAAQATNTGGKKVLRLTPDGSAHVSGAAWFSPQQSMASGFTSVFQFQITHTGTPADGFAFVIQNSSAGTEALGGSGGALGYGAPDTGAGDTGTPIDNSLAVEFDTFQNSWDPDSNHIAVQSCGTGPNSQDHTSSCKLGLTSLDPAVVKLADGNVHTAIVEYDPPGADNPTGPGTLRVFVDDATVAKLTVSVNLTTLLNLNSGPNNTLTAFAGFTGATGALFENSDILSWTFTPATAQTSITQTLTATGSPATTSYVFGSYNHNYTYSTTTPGDQVTVTAIPTTQADFAQRLGTQFPGAQCLVYDGTGALCVLFRVSCSSTGTDCTSLPYDLFDNFNNSSQGNPTITGACMLKAPVGTTGQWQNIIESFTQTRTDPGSKSHSNGFSDFILAQHCTAAPTIATSPANGATVPAGLVTITFTCTPDPNAPLVTVPPDGCTAKLNGTPVTSGSTVNLNVIGSVNALIVTATDTVGNTNTQTSSFTIGQAVSVSPSIIKFGTFFRFKSVRKTVKIQNIGTVTVQISDVFFTNLSGADAEDFQFINFCHSSLAPGGSCVVVVIFTADDLGPSSAILNIADDAPGSPQQVYLSANVKRGD